MIIGTVYPYGNSMKIGDGCGSINGEMSGMRMWEKKRMWKADGGNIRQSGSNAELGNRKRQCPYGALPS